MLITNTQNTPFGEYETFKTHLLLGQSNTGSLEISLQITEVEISGVQFLHRHEEAQCYYILSGCGEIFIEGETREVKP